MKRPIAWHEEYVLTQQQEEVSRLRCCVQEREHQITEAKRRGMDGFDRERFLKKRKRT